MKTNPIAAVCLGTLALIFSAHGQAQGQVHKGPKPVAVRDVSVVPMDTERVVPHQTVIVQNGRIVEVGPASSVHVPSGATIIDGRGRFLLPGLADMHTHVDRKEMLPCFWLPGSQLC
jgi:adenine deaminase